MTLPLGLTLGTAERTGTPSDIRTGTVIAVTSRGIDVAVAGGVVEGAGHLTSYNPAVGDPVTMISYANSWIVLGRILGPGTPTDGASPGLGLGSTILDGVALSGTNTDIAVSTGSVVTVPRYAVSFFHPANHWVVLRLGYSWYSSVAGDVMQVKLNEPGGTSMLVETTQVTGGIGNYSTFDIPLPPTLGDAARSWTMTLQRVVGTGTTRVFDPPNRRGSLIAYDLGDQSMIRTV